MSSEQDVVAKLAAAGWQELDADGCEIVFWGANACGDSVGAVKNRSHGGLVARTWMSTGEVCGYGANLVPLPAPPQESERLSDKDIADKLARDLIESRGVIAELREQNKHLGESVRELTTERLNALSERDRIDRCRDALQETVGELREQVATLTRERDQQVAEVVAVLDSMPDDCVVRVCEGGGPENVFASLAVSVAKLIQQRDELREEVDTVRGMNRNQARLIDDLQKVAQIAAIERHNLERSIDLQHDQIGHQAKACEEAEKDRDGFRDEANRLRVMLRDVEHGRHAARELCRRMRDSLIGPGATPENVRLVVEFDALDKVANSGHPAPAEAATGEIVPWTAETRPRGTIWVRLRGQNDREWSVLFWCCSGFNDSGKGVVWNEAFRNDILDKPLAGR